MRQRKAWEYLLSLGTENCWCGHGLVIDDFASRCDGCFKPDFKDFGQVIADCKTSVAACQPIVKVIDDLVVCSIQLVGIADGHILRSTNQMMTCFF